MRRFRRYPPWSVWMILTFCAAVAARYSWKRSERATPHAADGSSLSGKLVPGEFAVVRVERADLIVVRQQVAVPGNDVPQNFELPVQLLGVQSPDALDEGTEFSREFLNSGTPSLELDRRRIDPQGRFLAYVYVDGKFLNEEVIRAGLAQADLYPGDNPAMHKSFVKAEREARKAGRGIWASAGNR